MASRTACQSEGFAALIGKLDPTAAEIAGPRMFLSVDPLIVPSDPQSHTGYSYARNNPISFNDPTGMSAGCGPMGISCWGHIPQQVMDYAGASSGYFNASREFSKKENDRQAEWMAGIPAQKGRGWSYRGGDSQNPAPSQRSVEGGGSTTVDSADAAANLKQARADVIAGLRRGRAPLNLGVEEHLIKGGYDAIDFELVESLGDGVYGEIDLGTQTDFGRVGVKIRVSHLGASTLAEARATIGHEIRHLAPANIRLSPKPPPGMHQSFSPQERDAERFGIRTRRFFE